MSVMTSLIICAIFALAAVFGILQVKRWGRYWPLAYVLVAVGLVLPLGYWLPIEFLRGYLSDLSVATVMMLLVYLFKIVKPISAIKIDNSFRWFVLAMALLLYPMTLGLTQFDPFALGYASNEGYKIFVSVLVIIGFIAWLKGVTQVAYLIALSLLAHGLGLYESQNLWVYLIDPIAVIMCLFGFIIQGISRLIQRQSTTESSHV